MSDDTAGRAQGLFEKGLLSRESFAIWGEPSQGDSDCLLCGERIARGSMCIEEVNKQGARFFFHPRCHLAVMAERHRQA